MNQDFIGVSQQKKNGSRNTYNYKIFSNINMSLLRRVGSTAIQTQP